MVINNKAYSRLRVIRLGSLSKINNYCSAVKARWDSKFNLLLLFYNLVMICLGLQKGLNNSKFLIPFLIWVLEKKRIEVNAEILSII